MGNSHALVDMLCIGTTERVNFIHQLSDIKQAA